MIFYFSGTGNTRWAASEIANSTGEQLIDMAEELCKLGNNFSYTIAPGETVGFCFPVHGWRTPLLVRRFLSRIRIVSSDGDIYCWAVCTAGDDIGHTMHYLQRDLDHLGLKATALFSLIMPESYVGLPFMDVDPKEKEQRKLREADDMLHTKVIPALLKRDSNVTITHEGGMPWTKSHVLGAAFEHWLITDKPFRVDASRCTSCGLCAKVCPVKNIDFVRGKQPEWLHTELCLSCFACYHHCPTRAIEYGHRTKGKGQYFHKPTTPHDNRTR